MSELAWSLTPGGSPQRIDPNYGPAGIAYSDRGTRKNSRIKTTRPESSDRRFCAVADLLKDSLRLQSKQDAVDATSILLEELEAPASAGATRTVATPLTIQAALLQDRRGVTGKNNPANVALILEQMYRLGGGCVSVSGRWASALLSAGPAGLPVWASDAIAEIVPATFLDSIGSLERSADCVKLKQLRQPAWLSQYRRTPFHWFASSWDRLCSDDWIDKMPRRRWTDWAACIARTAIATGFMFEMHMARRMIAAIVSSEDPESEVRSAMDESNRLFTWDDGLQRVAADVGPSMNRLAAVGTECLSLLANLVAPEHGNVRVPAPFLFDDRPKGLCEWLVAARSAIASDNERVREEVSYALDAKRSGSANNIWETMRYSLLDRSESGADDLYALLRSAGRFTWIEPGQEWLVTVASLQALGPGRLSRLTDLREALSAIGIEASQQTLVARLESFGLARSSHDADDALEIMSGF